MYYRYSLDMLSTLQHKLLFYLLFYKEKIKIYKNDDSNYKDNQPQRCKTTTERLN